MFVRNMGDRLSATSGRTANTKRGASMKEKGKIVLEEAAILKNAREGGVRGKLVG